MMAPATLTERHDDLGSLVAALQIRASHQADALMQLIGVIEELTLRIEAIERTRDYGREP
jgi:hypothetical protein